MTVSYRPTQNSQEPEPQHPDDQQPWGPVAGPQGEPVWHPQQSPAMIQRNVVGRPYANAPGGLAGNIQPGSYGQVRPNEIGPYSAPPGASNGSPVQPYPLSVPPAPFIQFAMPMPPQGQAVQPVGTNGADWRRNSAGAAPGGSAFIAQGVSPQATNIQSGPPPQIYNGNIILFRSPSFFLSTVYRPGQRQDPIRKPTGHTVMMPKVTLHTTKQTRAIPLPAWLEAIIVFLSLAVTFVAHAYNLFNFPRYELDEGTYMSNAWAITQGLISPYPYGYGHPPLAWMQIAAWMQLTGGPFTFGNALNSGRVFMLFYAIGSALLVYVIVRRWSGSVSAALLALIIFSLSPLSVTFQRQIYLDNVATFWLLLSLFFLAVSDSRLLLIVLAAISFGISVLSKEIMLLFFPVMLYAAWLHTTRFQRKFGLVSFTYTLIAVCSGFVLMAVLKDELFPYAWHLPWDTHVHLSMLDTFLGQAQRSQTNGSFITSWAAWLSLDRIFIICSIAAPLFNLL